MARPIDITEVLPVYKVENDLIVSKRGDVTAVFTASLPEIFSLSDQEYEAFHQAWIRALKILPPGSIFHKQDWFIQTDHRPDFTREDISFLSRSSERFFNERPCLDHSCYIMLTRTPQNYKPVTSVLSTLGRRSIVPAETVDAQLLQDFLDSTGQFQRILADSGFMSLRRLTADEITGSASHAGYLEQYCSLRQPQPGRLLQDIQFKEGLKVGAQHCQLYTLADVEDLPPMCGSRINYDKYSTDRTKFSIGFSSPLGQLLPCNHIYNQYVFIGDLQKTLKQLESKRRRL